MCITLASLRRLRIQFFNNIVWILPSQRYVPIKSVRHKNFVWLPLANTSSLLFKNLMDV